MVQAEWFDKPSGEPVTLSEADPLWPEVAAQWAKCIRSVITSTVATDEHAELTSNTGLVAKPALILQTAGNAQSISDVIVPE